MRRAYLPTDQGYNKKSKTNAYNIYTNSTYDVHIATKFQNIKKTKNNPTKTKNIIEKNTTITMIIIILIINKHYPINRNVNFGLENIKCVRRTSEQNPLGGTFLCPVFDAFVDRY